MKVITITRSANGSKGYYKVDFDKCETISDYMNAFSKAINKALGISDK